MKTKKFLDSNRILSCFTKVHMCLVFLKASNIDRNVNKRIKFSIYFDIILCLFGVNSHFSLNVFHTNRIIWGIMWYQSECVCVCLRYLCWNWEEFHRIHLWDCLYLFHLFDSGLEQPHKHSFTSTITVQFKCIMFFFPPHSKHTTYPDMQTYILFVNKFQRSLFSLSISHFGRDSVGCCGAWFLQFWNICKIRK